MACSSGDGTSGEGEPAVLVVRSVQGSCDGGDDCLLPASRLDGRGRFCLPAAKLLKACRGSSGCDPQPDRWREALPAGEVALLKWPAWYTQVAYTYTNSTYLITIEK